MLCGVNTLVMIPAALAASPATDNRPNVLLIAIDDMKPWISPYGDTIAQTPAMDELASRLAALPVRACSRVSIPTIRAYGG